MIWIEDAASCPCAIASEQLRIIEKKSSDGRANALRVKVFGIEEKKNEATAGQNVRVFN